MTTIEFGILLKIVLLSMINHQINKILVMVKYANIIPRIQRWNEAAIFIDDSQCRLCGLEGVIKGITFIKTDYIPSCLSCYYKYTLADIIGQSVGAYTVVETSNTRPVDCDMCGNCMELGWYCRNFNNYASIHICQECAGFTLA
jgi:hypothetical protein